MLIKKAAVVVVLLVAVLGVIVSLPEKSLATSCPAGETQLDLAIAPNDNSLVVCQNAAGRLVYSIYNQNKTLLTGPIETPVFTTLRGLYVTPDSKFLLLLNDPLFGLIWKIFGSGGETITTNALGGGILQGVASTNDSKIGLVVYGGNPGALRWFIYGSNGVETASGSQEGGSLRSLWATGDNKLHVEVCHTPSNSVTTYNYGVNGTLESTVGKGPCSQPQPTPVPGVGGIAELPQIEGSPAESGGSSGFNYTPYVAGGIGATLILVAIGAGWVLRRRRA